MNEGVRQGYEDGYLRKSVVMEPLFSRENTGDNTPAVIHTEIVSGENLRILVVPKGAGSENMGAVKMLKPADGLEGAAYSPVPFDNFGESVSDNIAQRMILPAPNQPAKPAPHQRGDHS